MSTQLKFSAATTALGLYLHAHNFYKLLKKNATVRYGLIAAVFVVMALLIAFREGGSFTHKVIDFDPYVVLGVTKETPKKDIARIYRRLAITMHPDKSRESAEVAKRRFITLQRSKDILMDDKKRENLDKYGDPEPPSWFFQLDSYPDFIMNPGKGFIGFYVSMVAILCFAPFAVLVFIPGIKTPPSWILEHLYAEIQKGEELLEEPESKAVTYLNSAQESWDSLREKFHRYKKTDYSDALDFHIQSRIALYYIFSEDFDQALVVLKKLRENEKRYKKQEVRTMTFNQVKDLKSAISDLPKKGKTRELVDAVQSLTK